MLDGKHLSGASKSGLDFIGDKKDSVVIQNFLYFFEIVSRRDDDSTLAHDWLGNECGDVVRSSEADDVFNRSGTLPATFFGVVRPLRPIGVRRRSKGDARSVRAATPFASDIAGDAERPPTAPMKTGVQRDEFMFASVESGQFHGAFNGFCATISKESFSKCARCDLSNLFGEVRHRSHVVNVRRAVHE